MKYIYILGIVFTMTYASIFSQNSNTKGTIAMKEVHDFPWRDNEKLTTNTCTYPEIKDLQDPTEDKLFKYVTDGTLMQGSHVTEMQMKLAHVFFNYNKDVYYSNYQQNKIKGQKITSGIYNFETMEMVKIFQDIYMSNIFVGNKEQYYGYGYFDEGTMIRLEEVFQKLRRKISMERRKKVLDASDFN